MTVGLQIEVSTHGRPRFNLYPLSSPPSSSGAGCRHRIGRHSGIAPEHPPPAVRQTGLRTGRTWSLRSRITGPPRRPSSAMALNLRQHRMVSEHGLHSKSFLPTEQSPPNPARSVDPGLHRRERTHTGAGGSQLLIRPFGRHRNPGLTSTIHLFPVTRTGRTCSPVPSHRRQAHKRTAHHFLLLPHLRHLLDRPVQFQQQVNLRMVAAASLLPPPSPAPWECALSG